MCWCIRVLSFLSSWFFLTNLEQLLYSYKSTKIRPTKHTNSLNNLVTLLNDHQKLSNNIITNKTKPKIIKLETIDRRGGKERELRCSVRSADTNWWSACLENSHLWVWCALLKNLPYSKLTTSVYIFIEFIYLFHT